MCMCVCVCVVLRTERASREERKPVVCFCAGSAWYLGTGTYDFPYQAEELSVKTKHDLVNTERHKHSRRFLSAVNRSLRKELPPLAQVFIPVPKQSSCKSSELE